MLPILIREIVEKRKVADRGRDCWTILPSARLRPGIICVNISTFMGYRMKGFWGALIRHDRGHHAVADHHHGQSPQCCQNFADIAWVQHAFAGIRIAVCALIASVVWKLAFVKRKYLAQGHDRRARLRGGGNRCLAYRRSTSPSRSRCSERSSTEGGDPA